ncbi:hypothetical protein K2173_002831 [Erythroxylum novogranatense]|uniref:Uncharacterized protein n=1 Tax=Erythroxylum novogranatense TaxID=1862640 RepID=A0AAV8SR20_9ROSI|nr:hypothetical protein K2173_002831 [Erythroxylum novogranatense]
MEPLEHEGPLSKRGQTRKHEEDVLTSPWCLWCQAHCHEDPRLSTTKLLPRAHLLLKARLGLHRQQQRWSEETRDDMRWRYNPWATPPLAWGHGFRLRGDNDLLHNGYRRGSVPPGNIRLPRQTARHPLTSQGYWGPTKFHKGAQRPEGSPSQQIRGEVSRVNNFQERVSKQVPSVQLQPTNLDNNITVKINSHTEMLCDHQVLVDQGLEVDEWLQLMKELEAQEESINSRDSASLQTDPPNIAGSSDMPKAMTRMESDEVKML